MKSIEERFFEKVLIDADCWLWDAHINKDGYGKFRVGGRLGKSVIVSRLSYEWFYGIELNYPSWEVDHLCRVRHCVNPAHLEAVDHTTNMGRQESYWSKQTHCSKGHEFSLENTYRAPSTPKKRACRICRKLTQRR